MTTTVSDHQMNNLATSLPLRTIRSAGLIAIAFGLLIAALPGAALNGTLPQSGLRSIHIVDGFESGQLDAWEMPQRDDWEILAQDGNHYLHMRRMREPGVPRRPVQFALRAGVNVGSFDLRARVRREGRSMIVVFNYVDTLHFYYAHLSVDRGGQQPVHNGIFLVNNAPRVRIAGLDAVPALPDHAWHQIRVRRDAAAGVIEVWSDVQSTPLFTVVDRTFACGQIGIGSFDETGDFDDVDLSSDDAGCMPRSDRPGGEEQIYEDGWRRAASQAPRLSGRPLLGGSHGQCSSDRGYPLRSCASVGLVAADRAFLSVGFFSGAISQGQSDVINLARTYLAVVSVAHRAGAA